jgi:hypothetical protein
MLSAAKHLLVKSRGDPVAPVKIALNGSVGARFIALPPTATRLVGRRDDAPLRDPGPRWYAKGVCAATPRMTIAARRRFHRGEWTGSPPPTQGGSSATVPSPAVSVTREALSGDSIRLTLSECSRPESPPALLLAPPCADYPCGDAFATSVTRQTTDSPSQPRAPGGME